jgi:hypothetical protein
MRTNATRLMAAGILLFGCVVLNSCSDSNAPKEGTPAFFWEGAKETFATGDYTKTVEHLEKLTATDNEFTARARPWLLIMMSGITRGYMDMADSFDAGAHANKTNPTAFRRNTNTYRAEANRTALEFVQVFDKFQQGKDDPVPVALPFPTGSAAPVAQLSKAAAGMMLAQGELEPVAKRAVGRGVLLATCAAAGAPDDPAKTQELLRPGTLQVPRAAFLTAMATTLFEESKLYGARQIGNPERAKVFCDRALAALKTVPETKQTKELSTKITKSLKTT